MPVRIFCALLLLFGFSYPIQDLPEQPALEMDCSDGTTIIVAPAGGVTLKLAHKIQDAIGDGRTCTIQTVSLKRHKQ